VKKGRGFDLQVVPKQK